MHECVSLVGVLAMIRIKNSNRVFGRIVWPELLVFKARTSIRYRKTAFFLYSARNVNGETFATAKSASFLEKNTVLFRLAIIETVIFTLRSSVYGESNLLYNCLLGKRLFLFKIKRFCFKNTLPIHHLLVCIYN